MRKLLLILLFAALPAQAQEPDPAQMLARPRLDPVQQQFNADYNYCRQFACVRECMADLNTRRRPIVVAPPPGYYRGPDMTLCETTRIDSDYSTTDCF
jgi:hypothetical protein